MTEISKGDICIYYYAEGNGSLNIVEVTEVVDNEKCKIKCVQVIIDNSGNGWFEYLHRKGGEMCASIKYLHKLCCNDLINRQKAEIERLKGEIGSLNKKYPCTVDVGNNCLVYARSLDDYDKLIGDIGAEAAKEFAERLKAEYADFDEKYKTILPENINKTIDDLLKERVGGEE